MRTFDGSPPSSGLRYVVPFIRYRIHGQGFLQEAEGRPPSIYIAVVILRDIEIFNASIAHVATTGCAAHPDTTFCSPDWCVSKASTLYTSPLLTFPS